MIHPSHSWNQRRSRRERAPYCRSNPVRYAIVLTVLCFLLLTYYNVQIARQAFSERKDLLNLKNNRTAVHDPQIEEVVSNHEPKPREESLQTNPTEEDHETSKQNANATRHLVVIMVGAVRAIEKTALLTLKNLVAPLCSPLTCTSHLVSHLSYSDNRPDQSQRDPKGRSITLEETEIIRIQSFVQNSLCSPQDIPPLSDIITGFDFCHKVLPSYNIGSDDEQRAMDDFETEFCNEDPALRNRIRSLRYGDPRRYSMWFARNYAWRFAETALLSTDTNTLGVVVSQDQHVEFIFVRPDLLWYLPFASWEFLQSKVLSDRDIWVHDSYYANIPDTWSYLPNVHVAKSYFSLLDIAQHGVACLGGPDFNKTLAEARLVEKGILDPSGSAGENAVLKWCQEGIDGWSEDILISKLHRLNIQPRYIPAGVSLLRANWIDCQPVHTYFFLVEGGAAHHPTPVPTVACWMVGEHFFNQKGETLLNSVNSVEIFRVRESQNDTNCLTLMDGSGNLGTQPCNEHPPNQTQLFASSHVKGIFALWDRDVFRDVSSHSDTLDWNVWKKDFYRSIYHDKTFERRKDA